MGIRNTYHSVIMVGVMFSMNTPCLILKVQTLSSTPIFMRYINYESNRIFHLKR